MSADLYQLLQVAPDATTEQVRKAYFELAKKLHPDRQVEADATATERFLAVQNAYEVLIDPARREDYDRLRVVGEASTTTATATEKKKEGTPLRRSTKRGPSIDEARDARRAYDKAVDLHDAGEVDRALRAMQVVVRTVPDQPDYQSFLGYLMAIRGQRLHAARDHCRRAVEAEDFNGEFHARLGFVYMKAGLENRAQHCFEEALVHDPTNALALEHSRGGKVSSPGGILSGVRRLFGR